MDDAHVDGNTDIKPSVLWEFNGCLKGIYTEELGFTKVPHIFVFLFYIFVFFFFRQSLIRINIDNYYQIKNKIHLC